MSTIVHPRPAGCPLLSTDVPYCPSMPGVYIPLPKLNVEGSNPFSRSS
jgi:hypothetical protein